MVFYTHIKMYTKIDRQKREESNTAMK